MLKKETSDGSGDVNPSGTIRPPAWPLRGFWLMTILTDSFALFLSGGFGQAANLVATVCYIAATLLVC